MGVSVVVYRTTTPTTTGTWTPTTSALGGLTPKACLIFTSLATTDATAAAGGMIGVSAADGTNFWNVSTASQDAAASSNTGTVISTSKFCVVNNPASPSGTGLFECDSLSFTTNGASINVLTADGNAYLVTFVFFAGTDLSVDVDVFDPSDTLDGTVDVTTVGFEADVLFTAGTGLSVPWGVVHNNRAGTVAQSAAIIRDRSGRPTMELYGRVTSSYGTILGAGAFTGSWVSMEYSAFDSTGFTATTRTATPAAADRVYYLALRFGTTPVVSSKVYTRTTPTATGNNTDTGAGFQPQFVMYLTPMQEALDTLDTTGLSGVMGVSLITSGEQQSITFASQDAAADSNTQSLVDNQAVNVPVHTGAAGLAATFVEFTSTGVTLNWSDIEANAKYWPALVIGAEATATYAPPPFRKPSTLRRM